MNNAIIRTENLTHDFANVRAVDNLSFDVPPGIVFGFLGPNGAGKTTTIHLLLGLIEPTAGVIEVLGTDVRTDADIIRSQTGALLEHTGLYERLSAEDNLEFYGRIWRIPAHERRARIRELLTHFNLWDRRKEKVGTWSRGMKQKLSVARTILHHPKLVFFDEPTAGLDPVAAAALRKDISRLATESGTSVFLTTHNLNEAEKLCERVAVINRGRLVAIGHPDELRKRQDRSIVRITGRGFTDEIIGTLRSQPGIAAVDLHQGWLILELGETATVPPLVRIMVGAGVEIEEIKQENDSLEAAFLKLMEEENHDR